MFRSFSFCLLVVSSCVERIVGIRSRGESEVEMGGERGGVSLRSDQRICGGDKGI